MATHRRDVSVVFGVPGVPSPAATTSPQPCLVPDLIGLEALGAHALARAAGVRLSVSVWQTPVGPWGLVLEQLPAAGTRVRRGTRLRVVVSGRPHHSIPDVRGLSLEAAIEQLSWIGFVPLTTARLRSPDHPVGHVMDIRPAPGTVLAYGSVVALSVATSSGKPTTGPDEPRPRSR